MHARFAINWVHGASFACAIAMISTSAFTNDAHAQAVPPKPTQPAAEAPHLPIKAGNRYFYLHDATRQAQRALYVREGVAGKSRVLMDPNRWGALGAGALVDWKPSPDGKHIAYVMREGNDDARTIRVMNVDPGRTVGSEIKWAKFTELAWVANEGILYSRFAEPKAGQAFQTITDNQTLAFHRVGSSQSADQTVYATPNRPKLRHRAHVTHDQRWGVITSSEAGANKHSVHLLALYEKKRDWKTLPLVSELEHAWEFIEGRGDALYFLTNQDAPKRKVVLADLDQYETQSPTCLPGAAPSKQRAGYCMNRAPSLDDLLPELAHPITRAQLTGNRLLIAYRNPAEKSDTLFFADLPTIKPWGTIPRDMQQGFLGKPNDNEIFFSQPDEKGPTRIFRLNAKTGDIHAFVQP
jgi:prolyl oligopeptidase